MTSDKEKTLLRNLFVESLNECNTKIIGSVRDLFVQIDTEKGEVSLYDDTDEQIGSCVIYSWVEEKCDEPSQEMIEALRETVSRLEQRGFWENPMFVKPFSIELVEEDFSTIEELLFIDDDLLKIDDPLLEGLNEDLDKFLDNLLGDIK